MLRRSGDGVEMWRMLAERHRRDVCNARRYRATLCLHPELFDFAHGPLDSWFAPPFLAAITEARTSASPAAVLRRYATEAVPGVYTFDMLSPAFCSMLLDELQHYEASDMPVVRPNSMNNYGVVLNSIGLEQMMDVLQRDFVLPMAAALFPVEGDGVDHHHTFMVQYKAGEDLGLDMHTDACDVTINVCLGKEFTGAGLTLCGLRGSRHQDERRFQYSHPHVLGRAIMHLGHQRHGADDIRTGERYNLIMWCKNSRYRLSRAFMSKYSLPPSSRGAPDLVCLSYTHDADYEQYKEYPPGKRPKPGDRGG